MYFVQQALGKVGGSFTLAEHLSLLDLKKEHIRDWGNVSRENVTVAQGEEDYVYAWSPKGKRVLFAYKRIPVGIAVTINEPHFLTYWSKSKRIFLVSDLNVEIKAMSLFPHPESLSPVAVASAISSQAVSTVAIANIADGDLTSDIRVSMSTGGIQLVSGEYKEDVTEEQLISVCSTDAWLRVAAERTFDASQKVCTLLFDPIMIVPLAVAQGSGLLWKKPEVARVSPSIAMKGLEKKDLDLMKNLFLFELVVEKQKRYYAFSKINSFQLICGCSLDPVYEWLKKQKQGEPQEDDDDWGILFTPGQLLPEEKWKPEESPLIAGAKKKAVEVVGIKLTDELILAHISDTLSPMRDIRIKLKQQGLSFSKAELNKMLWEMVKKGVLNRVDKDKYPWYSLKKEAQVKKEERPKDVCPEKEKKIVSPGFVARVQLGSEVVHADDTLFSFTPGFTSRFGDLAMKSLQSTSLGQVYFLCEDYDRLVIKNINEDLVGCSSMGQIDLVWGHTYVMETYVTIDESWRTRSFGYSDLSNGAHMVEWGPLKLIFNLVMPEGQIRSVVEEHYATLKMPKPALEEITADKAPRGFYMGARKGAFVFTLTQGRDKSVGYGHSKRAAITEVYYMWARRFKIPLKRAAISLNE